MEIFKITNLSFAYPGKSKKVLDNISLTINDGDFVTLCGKSGCGKTTFLRLLKPTISPHGNIKGEILFKGTCFDDTEERTIASSVGFVMQNPDNQIVTDKVWHELAFGMESLGFTNSQIRTRVAEIASFFGIEKWFYKKTNELSGGQKQLLNLASVMVTQPDVLILDEPTSQLDPIAATSFMNSLKKINNELGTTIIISEHRLDEAFEMSDRIIVMDEGRIISDDTPAETGRILKENNHIMYDSLPVPMRIFSSVSGKEKYPVTVREGKQMLSAFSHEQKFRKVTWDDDKSTVSDIPVIEADEVYFRYEKNTNDILRGLTLSVYKGEIYSLLGGNGTGKSTAALILSGIMTAQRGTVSICGKKISDIDNLYKNLLGLLPQNPQTLFCEKTVFLNLHSMISGEIQNDRKTEEIAKISRLCRIEKLLDSHPYDLSGGEQQRVALAMILLRNPEILILDEPTKGMDANFKNVFSDILRELKLNGVTIFMVSHDIEFCAENSDRCALMFDGSITSCGTPRGFFMGNSFYTTTANRMAKHLIPEAVYANDVIEAIGGTIREKKEITKFTDESGNNSSEPITKKSASPWRIIASVFFGLCLIATFLFQHVIQTGYDINNYVYYTIEAVLASLMVMSACPKREIPVMEVRKTEYGNHTLSKTIITVLMVFILIPLTIFFGIYFLDDRKYYFISLIIIIETMLPFCMLFEQRKPKAREIVVISVLCAIAVAGRTAFFMIPEFKPVVAVVIISGLCFGAETGFLVGSMTGFVSNFFFGHGPWTPWQMFAFGIIGFIAGMLFKKGLLSVTRLSLTVFGFVCTLVIYGGIMNPASVLMMSATPTWNMIKTSFAVGFPLDFVHALSSAVFLWFISEPMIEKLERIKIKYGLIKK